MSNGSVAPMSTTSTIKYQVTEWKPVWSDDEKRIDGYDSIREWIEEVPADKEEDFLETFCDNSESYTVKRINT